MKNIIILIILLCFCSNIYCQKVRNFGDFVEYKNYEKVHFEIYEPDIRIKATYKDISEVKNRTPVEILTSIISCNSAEWNDLNYDGDNELTDEYFKEKLKKGKYAFYEPIMALYYYDTEKKVDACLMKFALGNDSLNLKFAVNTYFEKKNNRWITAGNDIMGFPFMVARLSPRVLVPLLTGTLSDDSFINNMVSKTRNRYGGLDKIKLDNVLKKWKKDSVENQTYGEPFSLANVEPKKIVERIPMKGEAKIITEVKYGTSGYNTSYLYESPISLDKIERKQTKALINAYFNAKSSSDLQKISEYKIEKFPDHLKNIIPSQVYLIRKIYGIHPVRKNTSVKMFHFRDSNTKEDIYVRILSTRNDSYEDTLKITNDSYFNDLEWLFKNLSPETYHELIIYPKNKEGYSHPALKPDLDLLIDRENDAFSTEGLTDYFKKLKSEGKCKGCFTP